MKAFIEQAFGQQIHSLAVLGFGMAMTFYFLSYLTARVCRPKKKDKKQ